MNTLSKHSLSKCQLIRWIFAFHSFSRKQHKKFNTHIHQTHAHSRYILVIETCPNAHTHTRALCVSPIHARRKKKKHTHTTSKRNTSKANSFATEWTLAHMYGLIVCLMCVFSLSTTNLNIECTCMRACVCLCIKGKIDTAMHTTTTTTFSLRFFVFFLSLLHAYITQIIIHKEH